MQATRLPFGIVNAPGQRYHPAIVAQAVATLNEVFDGRFWIATGSGQALNELFDVGLDHVYVHQVGPNQGAFVDAFGTEVLPQFD